MEVPRQALPIELILLIIDCFLPSNQNEILPPSHETTKTLLALTQVSRTISPLVSRLLWYHCTYIDNAASARAFARALELLSPDDPRRPARLFLALYERRPNEAHWRGPPWPSSSRGVGGSEEDEDASLALVVNQVLLGVAPSLRRLIIDMPLATALDSSPETPQLLIDVRPGFQALANLEEFVSLGDSFSLKERNAERMVWASCWPKLRCLSLHNPPMNFPSMMRLEQLQTVVISKQNAFQYLMMNVKSTMLRSMHTEREGKILGGDPFALVFVDAYGASWTDLRPVPKARVILIDVGRDVSGLTRQELRRTSSHVPPSWIRALALRGQLWDSARAGRSDWPSEDDRDLN